MTSSASLAAVARAGKVSRRRFLATATALGITGPGAYDTLGPTRAHAQDASPSEAMRLEGPPILTVRLDLPREVFDQEKALEGPDYRLHEPTALPVDPGAREARFVDPVTVIAAMTAAVLAERVVNFVLSRRGQGVLVDTREKPPHVSVLAGVPQGFVLVIHPDGKSDTVPSEVAKSTLGEIFDEVLN